MKRLLAHPMARLALILLASVALVAAIEVVERGHRGLWPSIAATAITVLGLFLLIASVERVGTGRPAAAVGFDPRRIVRDGIGGLALGAGLFIAVVLQLALTGHYTISAIRATPDLAVAALLFALSAAFEEMLFRGVVFRLAEEWKGTWIALAVSAVLFGAAHSFNPGATWVSTVAIAVEAGVLLGAAFVVTKNLWCPIAVHFAWNYCEGPIFGTQISGHSPFTSLFVAHVSGPTWLTGGAFGPEAGAAAIATSLVASAALLSYATRNALILNSSGAPNRASVA
jgi:membrane protease YdiL (CAAX protease family)